MQSAILIQRAFAFLCFPFFLHCARTNNVKTAVRAKQRLLLFWAQSFLSRFASEIHYRAGFFTFRGVVN